MGTLLLFSYRSVKPEICATDRIRGNSAGGISLFIVPLYGNSGRRSRHGNRRLMPENKVTLILEFPALESVDKKKKKKSLSLVFCYSYLSWWGERKKRQKHTHIRERKLEKEGRVFSVIFLKQSSVYREEISLLQIWILFMLINGPQKQLVAPLSPPWELFTLILSLVALWTRMKIPNIRY